MRLIRALLLIWERTCKFKFPEKKAAKWNRNRASYVMCTDRFLQVCPFCKGAYRVAHLVADLDWVDFNFSVPPSCTHLVQPLLQNFNQPKQSWADSGAFKIQVYPTNVRDLMGHPACTLHAVHRIFWIFLTVSLSLSAKSTFFVRKYGAIGHILSKSLGSWSRCKV